MSRTGARTELFSRWLMGSLVIADVGQSTGNRFFVDSNTGTDAGGYGANPDKPVATIDYAIGLCIANKGDKIYVMPGHNEAIISATSLVCDIAGIEIIGLGIGTDLPLLTFTTAAAATISISAASVALRNLRLLSNFTNGITAGILLGAGADGSILDNLVFNETANTKEWLIGIKATADCDDLLIENCRFNGIAGGTMTSIISALGGTDRTIIRNNYLHGDASAAAVKLDVAASSDLQILDNRVINIDAAAGLGIAAHNSSTGFADGNMVVNLKDTVVGITGTGLSYGRNYYSNVLDKSCRISPAEDS